LIVQFVVLTVEFGCEILEFVVFESETAFVNEALVEWSCLFESADWGNALDVLTGEAVVTGATVRAFAFAATSP
jgi:hypothetical protein